MKVWETCFSCFETGRDKCHCCENDLGACTGCDGVGFVLVSRAKYEYFHSIAFHRDAKIYRETIFRAFSTPILANEFAKVLRT